MFDIIPADVDVPAQLAPADEVRSLVSEFTLGLALREVSLFRVFRLWDTDNYLNVYSDDPTVSAAQREFSTFSDFVKFLTRGLDISRSKIYSRLKTYSLLKHLRYTDRDMLGMMSAKPSLYDRALSAIYLWDQESRSVTGFKTDAFGDNPYSDDSIEAVRDFLHDLDGADSISDALSMLMHDVLGKPVVKVKASSYGELIVYYTQQAVDSDTGDEITGDSGEIVFSTDSEIPEWLQDELQKRFPN